MLKEEIEKIIIKKGQKKGPTQLARKTSYVGHETIIIPQKANKKKYEVKFSINPMLIDKINKKNQLKKNKKLSRVDPC